MRTALLLAVAYVLGLWVLRGGIRVNYSRKILHFTLFSTPLTVLVAAIGDGLAEPVGVRFGRHTYAMRALFTHRRYTRSLEGSACVLLSGFLAVYLLRAQLASCRGSPHTWDGPFLYLAGGLASVAVLQL